MASQAAIPASRFADSVGINTHVGWFDKAQWTQPGWPDAFIATGVKHMRTTIGHDKRVLPNMQKLIGAGVKTCALMIGGLDINPTLWPGVKADLDWLAVNIGVKNISAIEGANEFNNPRTKPADWVARLKDFTKWLHDTVRADARFNGVPIIGPSLWGNVTADFAALGSLAPNIDKVNSHHYTGGRRPTRTMPMNGGGEYSIDECFRITKTMSPNSPLWVTEQGYDLVLGTPINSWLIPERPAAKYSLRMLFDCFARGVEKSYIYELLDDPTNSHHWGLTTSTLGQRMSYAALKNLMALFNGPASTLDSLDYTLTGYTPSIKSQLFQCGGAFLLVLYQDVDSYNRSPTVLKEIVVWPVNVTLTLAKAASKIAVFEPTFGTVAVKSGSGTSAVIAVADHVTVVRITP